MKRSFRQAGLWMMLALAGLQAGDAVALGTPGGGTSKKQPVLLTAREVRYDEPHAIATAIGKVEVVQGDTILFADRVDYNLNANVVHAKGHVSILQPTGDVFFAEEVELRNDLASGVVNQMRARLKDNSLFAAREAIKVSKNVTKMKDAVYSPCSVCKSEADATATPPLWQITARKATIDEDAQRVSYRDAFIDLYGLPVAYTPYLSHPTPDAPSQSGLLQPQYLHSSTLGTVVKEPVYVSFAPNMDMTLTPWYMTEQQPLLQGEFRHLTQDGSYEIRGAVTDTHNYDNAGNQAPGDSMRGYIEAHGNLQLDPFWDVGIDAERASDDTFLQLYGFGWQDMLTSRLYAERIENRDYTVIEAMTFQGLQPEDVSSQSPYVLPQASVHLESAPLAGHSRVTFDGSALAIARDEGENDQRLSSRVAWKLPYISPGGQVVEATASLRADAYNVNSQTTDSATGATFDGDTQRVIPEMDLNWRYPLIDRFGKGDSLMIAPIVEIAASPNLHMSSRIPNEDSQVAEFSDVNLFSPDRFTGLDQVESGLRGTYGMRGQLQFAEREYVEWLLGQAYQQNEYSAFPITNAVAAHSSDYVGRLALKYKAVDLSYSFRLDRETLDPISNEITANYTLKPLMLEANFIALHDEPLFGDRKEVYGNAAFDVTPNWTVNVGGRRDLGSSEEEPVNTSLPVSDLNPLEPTAGTVGLGTSLAFHNECMTVTTSISRSYISEQDVKPSTTFAVMLVLKNFGGTAGNVSTMDSASNLTTFGAAGNTPAVATAVPVATPTLPPVTPPAGDSAAASNLYGGTH